jgi:phosphoenolpyruvate-protein kinase (PTS system EI component)
MEGWPALLRVSVPDRPGALGLVASRIGALKADIVGIEVIERDHGAALDELAIVLPDETLTQALIREIEEVDGVAVVSITAVREFSEPRLDTVRAALELARAEDERVLAERLTSVISRFLATEWCAVVAEATVLAADEHAPEDADRIRTESSHQAPIGDGSIVVCLARRRTITDAEQRLVDAFCELGNLKRAPDATV